MPVFYTYLLLKKGVDYKTFSNKITHFYGKYIGDRVNIWKPIYSYKLQPLSDIHLRSNLQYEIAPVGNITQVYIFFTIGVFILLLAGINYTNLATARAIGRAKETAVKKVVGAAKKTTDRAIFIRISSYCFYRSAAFTNDLFFIAAILQPAYRQGTLFVFIPAFIIVSFRCYHFYRYYLRHISCNRTFIIQTGNSIKGFI
jgi:putative ABC transport system permease protein